MLDAIILSVMERTDRPRNTRKIFTKTSWEKKIKELRLQLWTHESVELFSIECHKTKTKVITTANQKKR